jgi:hypothetical protein
MDMYDQLVETQDWQIIELCWRNGLGSFNRIKIKLESPWLFRNSGGPVYLHQKPKLSSANGYWSLDGREFEVLQKNGGRYTVIATLRTEDCGLGTGKAVAACDYFGYRFKGFKV